MIRAARFSAVALLSASTLAFEVLLVRVFAIEQFHHFAFMAISVAMLGYGGSGTILALVGHLPEHRAESWFRWTAVATPIALLSVVTAVHRVSLDATQLPLEGAEWLRLAIVYLLLAFPFAVGALAILLAITLEPERTGLTYGASFFGAGLGVGLALGSLWLLVPAAAVALPAVVASLGALSAALSSRERRPTLGWALAAVLVSAIASAQQPWRLRISPYKGLPQVEAFPDARRVAERSGPLGWVVAVESSVFRHAPGLSLFYRGTFPRQTALFVDGDISDAASHWAAGDTARALLDWLPSAGPYALDGGGHVLVIGAGGGTEVWNALAHGARRVVAVELNPQVPELAGWTGGSGDPALGDAEVVWAIGDARSYIARTSERFDVITIGPSRGFGTSAAGVHALNEDFLHTIEAYQAYIGRLDADGVLAITSWIELPPRRSVRIILTAVEALRTAAPDHDGAGLVVMRSWATATVMVKPSGFAPPDIEALTAWADRRGFDLDWYPGSEAPAARFNVLDEPVLFDAALAATAGSASSEAFATSYPFDVAPVSDARPYPHHFLRARSLPALMRSGTGSWLPFAEWGYVALLATLAQSIAFAGLLLIVPAALKAGEIKRSAWLRLIGYFSLIGLAYLMAEIAAIQQLHLLLGHPVYAVAAVLAAFLVCSGVGSVWSDRRAASTGSISGLLLAIMLVSYGALLMTLVHSLQGLGLLLRLVAALAVLAPLAFLMGVPFPLGLRFLAGNTRSEMAWAWAANGFASVVATPLAALVALEAGSGTLFLMAAAAYAAAAGVFSLSQRGALIAQSRNP